MKAGMGLNRLGLKSCNDFRIILIFLYVKIMGHLNGLIFSSIQEYFHPWDQRVF